MALLGRIGGLLAWQWQDYSREHCDRTNLVVHMATVPAFIAGTLAFATQALHAQWFGAAVAAVVAATALLIQEITQGREAVRPVPPTGAGDAIARVFAEQFITFPRFVLMGYWARNLARPYNQG